MSTLDLFLPEAKGRFPEPRAFQEIAHRSLRSGINEGHQRQVLMAPTGAGKTYLGLRICFEALKRGNRALFICDRKTLINQTSETADRYGMPIHGIIQADNPRFNLSRPFQIASAQTLALRGVLDDFRVIVVDECHTQMEATTGLVTATKAAVIGLSATPFSRGLGQVYSRVVNAATMAELVASGVLVPLRPLVCVRPDMAGAKTTGGEWTAKAAGERGMELIGDVVKEWLTHAEGLKTIIFGPTIAHCEAMKRQFAAVGVKAALFTAQTTDAERKEILDDYRQPNPQTKILISVEALAKGFDVPDVGCVCDCRPLRKSLSTYIQMVGRGLRSFPGKQECVLLDFSGNLQRFAADFSDVYFNGLAELDSGERLDREVREDKEPKTAKPCPACGFKPMARRCISCGFEPVRESLLEHQPGEAVEFDPLAKVSKYAKSELELYAMIATVERNKAHARLLDGRAFGNPKGATWHKYREITGRNPPREASFSAPDVTPSREVQGKLRAMDIAYSRSLKKRS